MNSDFYFCIGKTHTLCQDYAEAGDNHVIISDGCSMAEDSHIGSLLLCRAAKAALKTSDSPEEIFENIKQRVSSYAELLELSNESLYATLGFAKKTEKSFSVALYGDGIVAGRNKFGRWDVIVREFTKNAPYYLAYQLDKNMESQYFKEFNPFVKHIYYEIGSPYSEDQFTGEEEEKLSSNDFFSCEYPYSDYDMVALLSDGASSFQKTVTATTFKRQESVPVCEILEEVLNFKNFNGQFVQRRCKAAFRKFVEENCANLDDFSLGVLYHESVYQREGSSS